MTTASKLRACAFLVGLSMVTVAGAADYWFVSAIFWSPRFGGFVSDLRLIGIIGALGSLSQKIQAERGS